MQMLTRQNRQCWVYLAVAFIALLFVIIYSISDTSQVNNSVFAFNKTQIHSGEYWRLITGHFLHTNIYHFVMNIVGLTLLYMLHGEYAKPLSFTINFLMLCVGISICIYFFSPNIQWYVGLSGVLHGLFAWGVIIDIKCKRKSGYLLLLGLIIKLIDEQFFESSAFLSNLIEANVAVDAHLYGAIFGIFSGLLSVILIKKPLTKHD